METETAKLGLQVSLAKTKVQNIGYRVQPSSLQVSGKQVQGVRLFEDSAISSPPSPLWRIRFQRFTRRIGLASTTISRLDRIWRHYGLWLIIIIIIIIIKRFIKRLWPWLQRRWRQVSRGCYSEALWKKYIRLKPRFKDGQWVSADYCLRQRVPDSWHRTTKSSSREDCPGERLALSSSGTADERSVRSLTRALVWRLRYVGAVALLRLL